MTIIKREIKPAGQYSGVEVYRRSQAKGMLQDVAFSNMTGVLHQLGLLSRYATEMFKEVYELASNVGNELTELSVRAEAVAEGAVAVREQLRMAEDPGAFYRPASLKLPEKAPLLQQGLFTKATRDPMLAASYRDCYGPPNVSSLDEYSEGGAGSCLKVLNPDFFLERWLQHEQEAPGRKDRRAKRRKKKKKRKKEGRNAAAKVQVKAVQKVARSGLGAEFDADTSAQSPSSRAHGRRGSSVAYERVDARDFNAQRPRRRSSRGLSVESMGISFTGDIAKEQASPVSTPPAAAPAPAPAPSPVRPPPQSPARSAAPALPPRDAREAPAIPSRGAPPALPPARRAAPAIPPARGARRLRPPARLPTKQQPRSAPAPPPARGAPPQAPPQRAAPPPAVRTVPDSDAFTPPPPPATNASPPHVPLSRVAMANRAQGYDAPSSAADSYAPPEVEVRRPSAFEIDEPARAAAVERVDPASDPRRQVRPYAKDGASGRRPAMGATAWTEELFGSGGWCRCCCDCSCSPLQQLLLPRRGRPQTAACWHRFSKARRLKRRLRPQLRQQSQRRPPIRCSRLFEEERR